MSAPPAFQVRVRRFGVWRAAMAAVTGMAGASLAAWGFGAPLDSPVRWVALAMWVPTLLLGLTNTWAARPFQLRWDTQCWFLGEVAAPGPDPLAGTLAVAVDLGPWMLLKFMPAASSPGRIHPRPRWLPVQRRGHEGDWHALRVTAHSASGAVAVP